MNIGFVVLLPIIFWIFILMLIIAVSKPKRRPMQSRGGDSPTQRYLSGTQSRGGCSRPKQTIKTTSARPQMQKGLFDMKLSKDTEKKQRSGDFGMFRNTEFDDYSAKGRKKDFVSGYDKKLAKGGKRAKRAASMQYSHTYDGHEPWDKCLPKEKDPWDKDFYA